MTKIASIQMCSSASVDDNLTTAAQLIQKAATNGAQLAVLPEMFSIIGKDPTDSLLYKEPFGCGKMQNFLAQTARDNNVWVVGGTIPIACEKGNKARAACLVFDNNGHLAGRYDKIHLFDAVISKAESYKESDTMEPGNNAVVIETPFGKLGVAICFDLRFPELFTELTAKGAEFIAVPAAFTEKTGAAHWEILTRCRAIDSFCYIIGATQGGTHKNGRKTYGHAIVIDPWGQIMEENTTTGNALIYADIPLEKVYAARNCIPKKR